MKKSIFISSLLAVCVTCAAHADDSQYRGEYIDGNHETGAVVLENQEATVTGELSINTTSSFPNMVINSTLKAGSISYNGQSRFDNGKMFLVSGSSVETEGFKVAADEETPSEIYFLDSRLTPSNGGTTGSFEIGANITASVMGTSKDSASAISMNTEVNGGTLNVQGYAAMNGITLNNGAVNVVNKANSDFGISKINSPINLGNITVENGILSLEEAAIVSDVTLNSGKLNIIGDVETGALTLNGGTINFDADSTIDLGEENLILGDNVAITLNVDSLDNIEGITLFKNAGNVTGLDALTVTFVDATGAEKEAAVSFSNGSVVTGSVPEPTTATLSLLALAGLAARRRRR
ncbi:MAG: PEP-CTERM sorting domain-containing protein [Akkermansia sp.]|nr:PEP-CTERM sorting domain-containing protein [Akkermansia sp.]